MDTAPMTIRGCGIVSVKSADIIKSKEGQRQLAALKNIKNHHRPGSNNILPGSFLPPE